METTKGGPWANPSEEQKGLANRFLAAHNQIEQHLRHKLAAKDGVAYRQLIVDYQSSHQSWQDGPTLSVLASLRNALIHGPAEAQQYLSIPLPGVVETMERIRDGLLNPELGLPRFARDVVCIDHFANLADVLSLIRAKAISQFPVFDGDRYYGLLTENGITRWFACRALSETMFGELTATPVAQIMQEEEQRENAVFVAPSTEVDEVVNLFATQPILEAVLITEGGQETLSLLGIATRWDIVQIRHESIQIAPKKQTRKQ
jgi:predicted transcriptional regulator